MEQGHHMAGIRARFVATLLLAISMATPAFGAPAVGDAAPDYAGRTLAGRRVSLADYSGKVVVLSFWASWCAPCRVELPMLARLQQVAGERVQVVAINIEDRRTFRRIARKMSTTGLMVASDIGREAAEAYGVKGIPHMVIIDKSGHIRRVNRGYSEEALDDILEDLNAALAD